MDTTTKRGKTMITPEMIISFPNLFEAKPSPSGVLKYSCTLLIDKNDKEGVKQIQDAINKAIEKGKSTKWGGKIPRFTHQPLRDGDAEIEEGNREPGMGYEGSYFLNCSSSEAPGEVGSDAAVLMDQKRIYAGCTVRADINPFPYKHSGNSGIGWGLNHVMLVRECSQEERLDGRKKAEDAFAAFAASEEVLD
jgi:hypothetical protein